MADFIAFSGVLKVVFNKVFFLKCTKCWKVMVLTISKKLLIKNCPSLATSNTPHTHVTVVVSRKLVAGKFQ